MPERTPCSIDPNDPADLADPLLREGPGGQFLAPAPGLFQKSDKGRHFIFAVFAAGWLVEMGLDQGWYS
jgi:hypothetical protein